MKMQIPADKAARISFGFLFIICAIMGAVTFVEKYKGSDFVHTEVFGSLWFSLLWAVAALSGMACLIGRRIWRRPVTALLHAALLLILAGALLTHVTGRSGYIHLRTGETARAFIVDDNTGGTAVRLPFSVTLLRFDVSHYAGTDLPSDYTSQLRISPSDGAAYTASVSMNKILKRSGVRLYQSSYDEDAKGTTLAANYDPYGTPVTYAGYALLFLSLILWLASPGGMLRRSLRQGAGVALLLLIPALHPLTSGAQTRTYFTPSEAKAFGQVLINYDGRVAPLETFAGDFLRKITGGKTSYKGLTPVQVLSGWIFFPHKWEDEALIALPSRRTAEELGLENPASYSAIAMAASSMPPEYLEQKIGHKDMAKLSEKIDILYSIEQGTMLKIFPVRTGGGIRWCSYSDSLKTKGAEGNRQFMTQTMTGLFSGIILNNSQVVLDGTAHIIDYQRHNGGDSLPTPAQLKCEHLLNSIPFTSILFKVNLIIGLIALVITLGRRLKGFELAVIVISAITGLALLAAIVLRTIVAGRLPLSNGYETMLAVAWAAQLFSLLFARRSPLLPSFGLLASGFMLLVATLQSADPKITPLMPVLSSPLLGLHVSVIMLSYALLALTFLASLTALLCFPMKRAAGIRSSLTVAVHTLLPPAIATLGIGIFTGAIWANVSWGSYWSWDSKEVWSLITFILYAFPLHTSLFPSLRKDKTIYIYIVAAFIAAAMTYFGVNMLLPGMHSYSGM